MHFLLIVCTSAYIMDFVHAAPVTENQRVVTAETLDKEIFKMPRTLRVGDEINITGETTRGREILTVNLVKGSFDDKPDFSNVACQVKLDFPSERSKNDKVTIKTIVKGEHREVDEGMKSTDVFPGNTFTIKFIITEENKIELDVMDVPTANDCIMDFGIDTIKYLTLGGDVHRVEALNFLLV